MYRNTNQIYSPIEPSSSNLFNYSHLEESYERISNSETTTKE